MRKILCVALTVLPLSFSAFADDVDSLSTTNDINNQSSQNSTGIVSNQPTFFNNNNTHAYNSVGNTSCAQASMTFGAGSSGRNFTNQGSLYVGVNIPFTSFGSGKTCEEVMKIKKAQMQYDTAMVLTDHCLNLQAKGVSYRSGNQFTKKCEGFERTEIGLKMAETQHAKLSADKLMAQANEMQARAMIAQSLVTLHEACNIAKKKGIDRFPNCEVHVESQTHHN